MSDKYKWDLSYIYKSDKDFSNDINNLEKIYKEKLELKGKLNSKKNYIRFLEIEEKETIIDTKLYLYSNIYSLDQTNLDFIRLSKPLDILNNKYRVKMSWILPELYKLKKKDVLEWIKDSKYFYYKFDIEEFYRLKKHRLNEKENELLSKVSRSMNNAPEIYSELTVSDNKNEAIKKGAKDIILSQKNFLDIMKFSKPLKDQEFRKEASLKFFKRYIDNKFTLSSIYQKIADSLFESSSLLKYNSPLEMKLSSNNIPKSVYFKLIEVAKKNSNLVRERDLILVKFLKTKHKLERVYTSDKMLELFTSKENIEVKDALNMIGDIAKGISDDYYNAFKQATRPGLIDYFESENKVKGAYSTGNIIYDPLILMNYSNDLDSVLTLAHEIGHSIHTILSNNNQKQPYQDYSIYLAEIASTTLEMLTIDKLIEKARTNKEKIYLVEKKVSTQIATFFRQAQFADFEHEVIEGVKNEKIFDHQELSNIFNNKSNLYGFDVYEKFNNDMDYTWTRISHFFQSPYYVYQYATCIAVTFNFLEKIKKGEKSDFIRLLKMGSSDYPNKILIENGIDLSKDETYTSLIENIKYNINFLKELLEK